ncbi:hypothetical protein EVAR_32612_1 [Eumeta japonica]|uniref:Uncharacterized protein n=1 Tax=Eumeta variegata TaxID=151549 RepID=A0A4C1WJN0_EUMVA|nr:hypothetical protein EVAR_32612_1 [Eumeta japonica]
MRDHMIVKHDILVKHNFMPQITISTDICPHINSNQRTNRKNARSSEGSSRSMSKGISNISVWRFRASRKILANQAAKNFSTKFAPRRNSPYIVRDNESPTTYRLKNTLGEITFNVERLELSGCCNIRPDQLYEDGFTKRRYIFVHALSHVLRRCSEVLFNLLPALNSVTIPLGVNTIVTIFMKTTYSFSKSGLSHPLEMRVTMDGNDH